MQEMEKRFLKNINLPDVPKDFQKRFGEIQEFFLPYTCAIREINAKLENLNQELEFTKERNPIQYINYRIKSPQSITEKIERN